MSNELKSAAVDWFVRMRAPGAAEEKQQHTEWLAQSAAHLEAYSRVERQWQELSGLESWAQSELQQWQRESHKKNRRGYRWLAALTAAAATAAVLLVGSTALLHTGGEHYETVRGEQRRIVLNDGSRIHLNSSTEVDVRFNKQAREVHLLRGEGLFDVAHEPDRPFVVEARNSKVVAVGTRFNVYHQGDDIAVTVLEGKVAIISKRQPELEIDNDSVLLEPNHQARIDKKGEVIEPRRVDAALVTSWDKGLLSFDHVPLRQVVRELGRYVSGDIQVAENVPDYPITGTIKIRDKETMLKLLAEVVPVTPVKSSSTITMLLNSPNQN